MVALIFFFFFSSQLSPRTKSRSATLPPPLPHTPSKYDITFLQAALKPFPLTSHAKHLALRLDIRFLVESRSPILPFNFDRSRIPFSPPENQNSRSLPRFDSFFRFRFVGRNQCVVRRTGVGRKWKYERIDRPYFRSLPGAARTNGVISVCPWNSFPIGKLASMPIANPVMNISLLFSRN